MKSHTGLTESKTKEILPRYREGKYVTSPSNPNPEKKFDEPSFNQLQNSEPTVQPSTPLSKECTDNNETRDSISEIVLCQGSHLCLKVPRMIHFCIILELISCTTERYRHIRKEGMTNIQQSRVLWERIRANPQAPPLLKCVYFCLGMTSAPENLDYNLQTWNDLFCQLIRDHRNILKIGSLFGLYLIAWTIYNCTKYGQLPSNTENILLLGKQKIKLSKEGAKELIDYCFEQTDSMSDFPLKPFFHITKLRWEFEDEGDLGESVAKKLLKGIEEVFQLCYSFDQEWMKIDSFGAIVSAINLKIEIAIYFKERRQDAYMFQSLKEEADGNLNKLTEYFERNCSNIPIYDEAWLCSVQSKFYRMIGAESQAHRYAERAVHLYLECGRHWRALEEAKHTGVSNLIKRCQSIQSKD